MRTAPSNWNTYLSDKNHTTETRVDINGVSYYGFDGTSGIWSLETHPALFEDFGIGNAYSAQADLALINPQTVPKMAKIEIYQRLKNGNNTTNWKRKGVFFTSTRQLNASGTHLSIHAYDAMRKGDQPFAESEMVGASYAVFKTTANYNGSTSQSISNLTLYWKTADASSTAGVGSFIVFADGNVREVTRKSSSTYTLRVPVFPSAYPMPDLMALAIAASKMDITIDSRTVALLNHAYEIQFPGVGEGAFTVRDVLKYIAAMYAGNAIINDEGQLRFVPLKPTNTVIDIGTNAIDINPYIAYDAIGEIHLVVDEDHEYISGSGGTPLEIYCPWGTQTIADNIRTAVSGYSFQPIDIDTLTNPDPLMELGDAIKANNLTTQITSVDNVFSLKYICSIQAPHNEEIEEEYTSSATGATERAVARQVAQTTATLTVAVDNITADVQDLDQQIGQTVRIAADGVTVTNADGDTLVINGGCVDATTLNAEQINSQNLNLTGVITFTDLNSTLQDQLNGYSSDIEDANEAAQEALDAANSASEQASSKSTTYASATVPRNPVNGDLWFNMGAQQGYTYHKWYRYNGSTWVELTDGEINTLGQTYSQPTAPTNPNKGDLWFSLNYSGSTYKTNQWYWYSDQSGWILLEDATALTAQQLALGRPTTYASTLTPSTPYVGDIWYNMGNTAPYQYRKWYRYNGSSWVEITNAEINPLGSLFTQATVPTSPHKGDMWYTLNYSGTAYHGNEWYFYDGAKWTLLADSNALTAKELAQKANDQVTAWTYNGTTYIDGTKLMTGTVRASVLEGGEINILNAAETVVGKMKTGAASSADYRLTIYGTQALKMYAADGDMYLSAHGSNGTFLQLHDQYATFGGLSYVRPQINNSIDLGSSSYRWKDVYAYNYVIPNASTSANNIITFGGNTGHPILCSASGNIRPQTTDGASSGSNYYLLGTNNNPWSGVYAYQLVNKSDRQDKRDITYGLDKYAALFDRLKPSYFRFKGGSDNTYHIGFIAQDVEEAATELGLDVADIGLLVKTHDDDRDYYSLAYNEFIALCVEQIQTLKAEKEQLEERLENIENRLSKLE